MLKCTGNYKDKEISLSIQLLKIEFLSTFRNLNQFVDT